MMTIPMDVKVPEKPCPMTVAMPDLVEPSSSLVSTMGMPAIRPSRRDIHMMETKGWILNFDIMTIITMIASIKTMINGNPVIFATSFLMRYEIVTVYIL
jgi:hypothetical protein